jgi:hypothetical protein
VSALNGEDRTGSCRNVASDKSSKCHTLTKVQHIRRSKSSDINLEELGNPEILITFMETLLADWAWVVAKGKAKSSASVKVAVLRIVVFMTFYPRVVCIKVGGWSQ